MAEDISAVLKRIPGVRHACDLDLLLFFYRHPNALLTSEQIVAYVGYPRERIATSLDGLIEAGFLTRSQNPSHAARLYVLELDSLPDGLLTSLLKVAATREGRQQILRLLDGRTNRFPGARLRRRAPVVQIA